MLNAFVNEIDKNDRVALFENLNVLNLDSILVDRFSVRGVKQFELSELFEAVSLCMPDYVVSDAWDFDFDKVKRVVKVIVNELEKILDNKKT